MNKPNQFRPEAPDDLWLMIAPNQEKGHFECLAYDEEPVHRALYYLSVHYKKILPEQEPLQLGVVEFHTEKNQALRDDFYMVIDDCTKASQIVDVFLMDIATILKRHGYTMKIFKDKEGKQNDCS